MHDWCRHYRGMHGYDTCEIGVSYKSVIDENAPPGFPDVPCCNPNLAHLCEHHELHTQEEIDEFETEVAAIVTRMANLMSGASDVCHQCGQPVTGMEKVGRSVYARPCGCRLWQGEVPEAWKGKESR